MKVSNEIRRLVAWLVSLTILSVFHDPAAAGLVNVSSPCLFAGPDADCSQYLFWDTVHPTTAGHAIFAERFRETFCGRCVLRHEIESTTACVEEAKTP